MLWWPCHEVYKVIAWGCQKTGVVRVVWEPWQVYGFCATCISCICDFLHALTASGLSPRSPVPGHPSLAGEEEHQGKLPLEVCYLRHAFGLGEHYNSTKKLLFVADSDGDGSADDEQQQQQQPVAGEEEITDGQGI